jgi:hypothetical protein
MADDATRIIALERLLEHTREKAKKDRTRLERELRRAKAQLREAQEKLERYERRARAVEQAEPTIENTASGHETADFL